MRTPMVDRSPDSISGLILTAKNLCHLLNRVLLKAIWQLPDKLAGLRPIAAEHLHGLVRPCDRIGGCSKARW